MTSAAHDTFRALLVPAFSLGAGLAVGLGALAWVLGAAPVGLESYLGMGVGAALLAGAAAMWVNGMFLSTKPGQGLPADGVVLAGRLQGLLAAALMIKLAVLVIAMFALQRFGVKFEATATFCIAFASASLVSQLASAGYLSHALGNRARPPATPAPPSSATAQSPANDIAES